jgi:predicted ribosome quality control (RQC) complex YloA/Tae2 family protein
MKTETIFIPELNYNISYLIGQNARDNFAVIDEGYEDDLWFHAKSISSCHVVCLLPNDLELTDPEKKTIIKKGAELCKENTNKLSKLHNVPIVYTELKNITKTKTPGLVTMKAYKTIII